MANALYSPLDLFSILGYPHDVPNKAIEILPAFFGNNVVNVKSHLLSFEIVIKRFT